MPAKTSKKRKQLSGTTRKDRDRGTSGVTLKRCPAPPKHLTDRAKKEWRRLAPIAHGNGYLGKSDLRAFELLAESLATESEMRELVVNEGVTVSGGSGGLKAHPALKAMETARNQATRLLIEFGLTPRSRGSVDPVPKDGQEKNPFGQI
ncbi:MAG: phage terminase small subunit P27 family [Acidiferrobacterales bacterium]|nr:phage terminase small subunit P27 family [Acidiferrobacterales bacterium]